MVSTIIINGTSRVCVLRDESAGKSRLVKPLPSGQRLTLEIDIYATYNETVYSFTVDGVSVGISSDDLSDAAEITIYETREKRVKWRMSKERSNYYPIPITIPHSGNILPPSIKVERAAAFHTLRGDAASRIKGIEESLASLVDLPNQVKICSVQCKNLVNACSSGITEMRKIYDALDENEMYELYGCKKLPVLKSSLDKLLFTLRSAEVLLLACGSDWVRMGLVVTIPLPAPGKKALSKFEILVKELGWNLDMIHFALQLRKDIGFKWDEIRCRSVLAVGDGSGVAAVDEMNNLIESASKDREDFLSQLENGSISTDDHFATVLKKRLEISALPDVYTLSLVGPSAGRRLQGLSPFSWLLGLSPFFWLQGLSPFSWFRGWLNPRTGPCNLATETDPAKLQLPLENFRISHLDPKINKSNKPLGKGTFKVTYKGEWCGVAVAIGVIEGVPDENYVVQSVKREALLMLRLQHPNVVGFHGWGFFDPDVPGAPAHATSSAHSDVLCHESVGFWVMELMDRDLRKEISELVRTRSSYGGPFSLPVAVDILQQIVEAMVHVHDLDHTHRDLKAQNCLVNRRPLVETKSQAPTNDLIHDSGYSYTVKLGDFGTSKMIEPEIQLNTANTGTREWMAPEVWAHPGMKLAQYDPKPADVFSFGMVCYEVITGKVPYDGLTSSRIKKALEDRTYKRGLKPLLPIPDTVSCPEVLKELMSKCWAYTPSDRPDFKTIQKDLWAIKTGLEIKDVETNVAPLENSTLFTRGLRVLGLSRRN